MASASIDGKVSVEQVQKAVDALLKYTKKQQREGADSDLFSNEAKNVWIVVTTKTIKNQNKIMPHRIPLKYPIVDPRSTPICLITKDPQREYKDLLEAKDIKFISRVVGIEKLKGKFKPFEPRRQLMNEHGMFLADDRIIPLLPKLLGKIFFKAKKQPIPVNLTHSNLKSHLESAVASTYLHQNAGVCTSVRVGTTALSSKKLLENIQTALPVIARKLYGEAEGDAWENVQSLYMKTSDSTSLPIWSCDPATRWDALDKEPTTEKQSAKDDDELPAKTSKEKLKRKKNTEDDEVDIAEQQSNKKQKTTNWKSSTNGKVKAKPVVEELIEVPKPKSKSKTKEDQPKAAAKPSKSKDTAESSPVVTESATPPTKPLKGKKESTAPVPAPEVDLVEKRKNKPSKENGAKSKRDKINERAAHGSIGSKGKAKLALTGKHVK